MAIIPSMMCRLCSFESWMSIPELPCRLLLNTSTSQNVFSATCPAPRVGDPSCLCAKAGLHPGQVCSLSQVPLWTTLMKLKWMWKVRGQNRSKSVCFHQSNKSSKPDLSRALYFCSEYCNNEGIPTCPAPSLHSKLIKAGMFWCCGRLSVAECLPVILPVPHIACLRCS